jgi:hypothetical protein
MRVIVKSGFFKLERLHFFVLFAFLEKKRFFVLFFIDLADPLQSMPKCNGYIGFSVPKLVK